MELEPETEYEVYYWELYDDDDFEDEVCFKRGRVVTPRFPDFD